MYRDAEPRLSLLGALRLAGFKADGVQFFKGTDAAARRSFLQVLPLMLMGFIALAMLRPLTPFGADPDTFIMAFTATEAERGSHMAHWIGVNLLAQIVKWTLFLVVVREIMRIMEHGRYFSRFVQVFNWMLVVRMMVVLLPLFLNLIGLVTLDAARIAVITVSWMLLVYQWFGYRTALQIHWSLALALIVLETILSIMIGGFALGALRQGGG
ncbi:MAG: hypothetical protein CL558_14505 [Alphaproteobacteria bacterium]|nr:hypothetical protein [Alphaproteobacteria bacterium]MAS48522.1 hypothetical protein [Alphaproteobacteria bacterium]MAX96220.1 hypothetical protein [Alphaproteobacteria bacterium]MBN54776.1 hypothetical protein [Alphaproteobacteria bacterium]OUT39177.1 MAG: hypothetical protein CBB62_12255 [Micavibrio sp. TMED2]|tara:strand:+ start:2119 stop:2754 length:636 start_codon:yes stop_codon:yes gene_type:complete